MHATTHIFWTILILLFVIDTFAIQNPIIFAIITIIATLLVDIDHPQSTFGKHLRPISDIIEWVLGHRGLLHSLLVPLFLFLTFSFLGYKEASAAVAIGYSAHIILDALTPAGVRIFYPLKYKINGPIKTGSWAENIFLIAICIAIGIKLLFLVH